MTGKVSMVMFPRHVLSDCTKSHDQGKRQAKPLDTIMAAGFKVRSSGDKRSSYFNGNSFASSSTPNHQARMGADPSRWFKFMFLSAWLRISAKEGSTKFCLLAGWLAGWPAAGWLAAGWLQSKITNQQ